MTPPQARRSHRSRFPWSARCVTTIVAAAVLALAGCGGSGDAGPATATSASPTSASRSSTPATRTAPASTLTPAVPLETAVTVTPTRVAAPARQVDSAFSLEIPSLGVAAPVVEAGVTDDLVLEIPSDPSMLGRWSDGARPGEGTGSVVLAGHVNYQGALGSLSSLAALQPGAEAVVRTPDGPIRYVTDRVVVYRKTALPAAEIFTVGVPERLVLVTCGGTFDRVEGHYDSNVVAYLSRA